MRYQEKEGNDSTKKATKSPVSSASNMLLLSGKLSTLESTFNENKHQEYEKDDDDDVAIPGKKEPLLFTYNKCIFTKSISND